MEYRSRLQNKARRSLYRNTLITASLIVVLVLLLIFFGLQLLVKLSLVLGNLKSIGEIPFSSDSEFLLPPTLDPIAEATNSATIPLFGIGSQPGQTIEIYLDDEYKTNALVDKELRFTISQLRLETGENKIKARAKQNRKESIFTQEIIVVYETIPPALEVQQPFNDQVVKKSPQVSVIGKTEPDASITLNDFLPIVDNTGNFSYLLPLQEGENTIKIIARDKAGNQTTNEIKVFFEP